MNTGRPRREGEGKSRAGGRERPGMDEAARGQRRKWSVEDKDENYCPEDT